MSDPVETSRDIAFENLEAPSTQAAQAGKYKRAKWLGLATFVVLAVVAGFGYLTLNGRDNGHALSTDTTSSIEIESVHVPSALSPAVGESAVEESAVHQAHLFEVDACVNYPCHEWGGICTDLPDPAPDSAAGRTCVCNSGWEGDGETCTEIDACVYQTCGLHGVCIDLPIPYGAGEDGRICLCDWGYTGDPYTECWNVDACEVTPCASPAISCTDYPPPAISGLTGRFCACPTGYSSLFTTPGICQLCPANYREVGGYCVQCTSNSHSSAGATNCACDVGYLPEYAGNGTLTKCTACAAQTYYRVVSGVAECNACQANARTDSTAQTTCFCNSGYESNGLTGDSLACTACDANEFSFNQVCHSCPSDSNSAAASSSCTCNTGYSGSGTGLSFACSDTNACAVTPCSAHATCTDLAPPALGNAAGRTCVCNTGYSGDGETCTDINACSTNPCDSFATCGDLPPPALGNAAGRTCTCNTNFYGTGEIGDCTIDCNAACPSSTSPCSVATCPHQTSCTGVTYTVKDLNCDIHSRCTTTGCVAVTGAYQNGGLVITEFEAITSNETIEFYSASTVDISGYIVRNSAGQTATIVDPSNPANPVTLTGGTYIYGVPNRTPLRSGISFVYGTSGTTFALSDSGDTLAVYNPSGMLQDLVDFSSWTTSTTVAVGATAFVGASGVSTQLTSTVAIDGSNNDHGEYWCTSFFPATGTKTRVSNTYGAANSNCGVVVINEWYYHGITTAFEDGWGFVEIAGPGGAPVGSYKIEEVQTTVAQNNPFTVTFGSTQRLPVSGFLLVADGVDATPTVSKIPAYNANPSVALIYSNVLAKRANAPCIKLWSAASSSYIDMICSAAYVSSSGAALYGVASVASAPNATYARDTGSKWTGSNSADIYVDPSPTPGAANDAIQLVIYELRPAEAQKSLTTYQFTIVGKDFLGTNMRWSMATSGGGLTAINSYPYGVISVAYTTATSWFAITITSLHPQFYGQTQTLLTRTSTVVTTNAQITNCFTDAVPVYLNWGQTTPVLYGNFTKSGITDTVGAPTGVIAQLGYSTYGNADPNANQWSFWNATWYADGAGTTSDVYSWTLTPPVSHGYNSLQWYYAFRFSIDGGLSYTWCDTDGLPYSYLNSPKLYIS